jgi:hypothetical protein
MLIDMFALKKKSMDLKESEIDSFKDLLYTVKSPNPLITSYNFLMAKDVNEIENYFEKIVKENVYKKKEREKRKLNIDAYEILKYSLEDINKMDADQLDEVNKKVYNYFESENLQNAISSCPVNAIKITEGENKCSCEECHCHDCYCGDEEECSCDDCHCEECN